MSVVLSAVTPVDARRQRVADLERISVRVLDELRAERAALVRITGYVERPHLVPSVPVLTVAPAVSVREWARANGHVVADRGRLPAEVLAAYEVAKDAGQD